MRLTGLRGRLTAANKANTEDEQKPQDVAGEGETTEDENQSAEGEGTEEDEQNQSAEGEGTDEDEQSAEGGDPEQDKKDDQVAKKATTSEGRIEAILTSAAGEKHPKLAKHLAFRTKVSATDALGILRAAGTPVAPKARTTVNKLDAAMRTLGNPKIGASRGGGQGDRDDPVASAVALGRRFGLTK